jgi:hypothetical protein
MPCGYPSTPRLGLALAFCRELFLAVCTRCGQVGGVPPGVQLLHRAHRASGASRGKL